MPFHVTHELVDKLGFFVSIEHFEADVAQFSTIDNFNSTVDTHRVVMTRNEKYR